jgi:acyl transferase domain-containing protein
MNTLSSDLFDTAVFLFPGQGNDPTGVLSDLHQEDAALRAEIDQVLDEVDGVATIHGFGSVREVVLAAPNAASKTIELPPGMPQLATYAAAAALDRMLAAAGIRPHAIVGQSLGEIAALVCAEVFGISEGAHAVCALNNAFHGYDGRGAMALVRANGEDTETLLARTGRHDLVLAGVNTPRQSVVSGPNEAVDELLAHAGEPGVPAMLRLPVPYATHHPSLTPVADQFLADLRKLPLRPMRTQVFSPVRRRAYTDADDLHEALADCVVRPVYLLETLQRFPATPDWLFIELGPGDTLSRCVRAGIRGARTIAPLAQGTSWLLAARQTASVQ